MKIECEWTGEYPNLCSGQWILKIDGVDVSDTIPFQGEPAETYGKYQRWYFDKNWIEVSEWYTDGLYVDQWIERNAEWLSSIAEEKFWRSIYDEFREWDWRYEECGGCI